MSVRAVFLFSFTSTCLIILSQTTVGHLTQRPENTVIASGSNAILSCSTNLNASLFWFWRSTVNGEPFSWIFNAYRIKDSGKYSVNQSAMGLYHLFVRDVRQKDAGVYRCVDNWGRSGSEQADADVVVILDSSCWTSAPDTVTEGDTVILECKIHYTGNKPPHVKWIDQEGTVSENNETFPIYDNEANMLRSNLTIVAGIKDIFYNCSVGFNFDRQRVDVWSSPKIQVFRKIRNLGVTPNATDYSDGDVLTCLADGDPQPAFEWLNGKTGTVTPGQHLTISKKDSGIVYTCRVSTGNVTQTTSVRITIAEHVSSLRVLASVVVSIGIIFIVVIFLLLVIKLKTRKKLHQLSDPEQINLKRQEHGDNEQSHLPSNGDDAPGVASPDHKEPPANPTDHNTTTV